MHAEKRLPRTRCYMAGSLEMKAGLAGAHDRQRGARQIRDGIVVVLDC